MTARNGITGDRCWTTAAAAGLTARTSAARSRQIHWVLGELHRHPHTTAAPAGGPRATACPCWELLTGTGARDYLDTADTGSLRARPRSIGDPRSTSASRRVRISILRALAAELTRLPGAPDLTDQPHPRPGPTPPAPYTDPDLIGRFLTALRHDPSTVGLRTAAAAHLAADGIRVGEMLDLRTDQISWDARRVYDLTRTPRGPAGAYQLPSLPLSAATAATVRDWLEVRHRYAAARVTHLFCSLAATSVDGSLRPAGLPATARTLDRSHRHAIDTWLLATNPTLPDTSRLAIADLTLTRLADRAAHTLHAGGTAPEPGA